MSQFLLEYIYFETYYLRMAAVWLNGLSRVEWLAIVILVSSLTMFVRWSVASWKDDQRVYWRT